MKLDKTAEYIIDTLCSHGYEAYVVGGYLRDSIMGRSTGDIDIATSATPDVVKRIFDRTVGTGIQHGTVLVICENGHAEVTTFRTDGKYSDSRHPDRVEFVKDIYEDLARRDFTVNAMAYSHKTGVIDPFGGQKDIRAGVIRTVGDPEQRFTEDALRILRCIRFAAVLGFEIEKKTADAAHILCGRLSNVSRERVFAELYKTVMHADSRKMELMLSLTEDIFPDTADIGGAVRSEWAESKWAHLCGEKSEKILRSLKAPAKLIKAAEELVCYRDNPIEQPCKIFNRLKYVTPAILADYKNDTDIVKEFDRAIRENRPIYINQLALGGADIMKLGFRNEEIGKVQKMLFEHILDHPEDNNKEKLTGIIERSSKF